MKRKIWTIVSMALLSGAFVACSDDNDFDPNGNQTGTEDAGYSSYLTINVSMSESGSTRADDSEGDITLAGDENERAIKLVNVYVFEKDSTETSAKGYYDYFWKLVENRAITAFTEETVGSKVTRFGTVTFKALLKNRTYRLYAVANGKAVDFAGNDWTLDSKEEDFLLNSRFELQKSTDATTGENLAKAATAPRTRSILEESAAPEVSTVIPKIFDTSKYSDGLPSITDFKDYGLIMASRQFDDMVGTTAQNTSTPYVEFTIDNDNSETNPASVVIAVERVMARLDLGLKQGESDGYDGALYVPTSSGSTDKGKKYATVTLTGYYPVNISQQSYLFRHRSTDLKAAAPYYYNNLSDANYTFASDAWTAADYIVDPFTTQKTKPYSGPKSLPTNYADMYYNPLHEVVKTTKAVAQNDVVVDASTSTTTTTTRTMLPIESGSTALHTIGYCLENTTTADNQQKEYSTALILAGTVVPEDAYVYFNCDGEAYTYKELSELVASLGSTSTDDTKLKTAQANLESAKTAYSGEGGAQADSTSKASELATAKEAYESAKSTYEASTKDESAVSTYNAAYNAYQTALTNYNAAVTAAKTAENAVLTAEATLNSLTTEATIASAALDEAKKLVDAKDKYTGDTLYYYNYNFYTSIFALRDVMVLPKLNGKDENGKEKYNDLGKSNVQILSEYGVTLYTRDNSAARASSGGTATDFVTYYLYIIKHYQHGATTEEQFMAPMKYAIVRNNVYQMTVSGVLALGSSSPDPTDPDPEDEYYPGPNPDDEQEVYLKMELQVRHWVVRDQGDIKLK
jgi:hypothetical protein